jgi:hypothetical protein
MPKSFEKLGLPTGHAFPRLAYHEPTSTLIAHTRPRKAVLPGDRLSFRRIGETHYQPIGEFPEGISISSFVLDPYRPALYFMTFAWRELDGGGWGGDWEGLYRFDLEQHRCDRLCQRGDLHSAEGDGATWLSDLLSVANDGRGLLCQAALGESQSKFAYWVARLDLADLRLTGITKLRSAFA